MSDENQTQEENANLAQLRAKADRADQLEARLALMEKQEAFRTAGLDISAGPGKLVFDTFQPGDQPVTAESVLAYATQYGVAPAPAEAPAPTAPAAGTAPAPKLTPQEQAHFQMVNAGTGSEPNMTDGPVGDQAYVAFDQELKNGVPRDRAAMAGLDALFGAASKGNTDAIYDQTVWRAKHGV